MSTHPTNGAPSETTGIPEDVQAEINNDMKATSRDRFRKLLRDAYYAGPIARGDSPEKNMGQNTSSPGSNLRRSRDGALWNLTGNQEDRLLETAVELGLLDSDTNNQYYTTQHGADVLLALDRCDDCGTLSEPHYEERTVEISRYSSGKNHSLVTKCPDCDDGPWNWNRDVFPPINTTTDEAERLTRSVKHAALYGTGINDWMPPERRALTDFIDIVQEESYRDFEETLERHRTPTRLSGAGKALRAVFNDYSASVCTDFASLLLDTFYGACLDDVERGVLAHIAAGYPETREHTELDTHATGEMEPLAVIEDDSWETTLRFEAIGEYVTISGVADRTRSQIKYETTNGMSITFSSSHIGRVLALPFPDEVHHSDAGDIATVVAFEVTNEPSYTAGTRVDEAFDTLTRTVNLDSRNCRTQLKSAFTDVIKGHPVKKSTFGNFTTYDLNNSELVKLARRLSNEVNSDDIPALVERYADRELQ